MRPDLPTGVVTLLFTDIEGSTRLLAELREGYIDALAEHRRVVRESVAPHGGVEVDSAGDAFLIAFARASAAVAAAVDAQRALADGPVKVRMGIHTGEPELTEEGYVGLDVHRGARIGDAGHGGQILLSATTRALVEWPVVELGAHRLDGIAEPEPLYGLVAEGLASDFPPLRVADASAPDLPTWLTSFVGRETELAQLDAWLGDPTARLITLVGPGGAGKTRLAAQAAERHWREHGVRAWFASAIPVEDGDGLVNAIGSSLGFVVDAAHGAGRSLRQQLSDYLAGHPGLIVVDNVEHVADAAEVLGAIAADAPDTTFLVTSRHRLGLTGEAIIEVGGLRHLSGSTATGATDPAVRMFLERARRGQPGLTVADDDLAHIRHICDLLDGMPLGIELAAAWIGTLSIADLSAELDLSLDLLESTAADLSPRHRSLRAAFAGSWRLLDEHQRIAYASLSVFVGSFDRQAAQAVAGADTGIVAQLVARSLVRRGDDGRFEIHELLRQFAGRELAAAGREGDVRESHAGLYTERLVDRADALTSAASVDTRLELQPDLGNLRAALEWAFAHWPLERVDPLLLPATSLWSLGVDPGSGEAWSALDRAARDGRPPRLDEDEPLAVKHAIAPHLAFALAIVDDNERAERVAIEALPHIEAAGRLEDVAMCRVVIGINACNRFEDAAAIEPLETADAALRDGRYRVLRGELLTWLGWARLMLDDLDGAREAFELAHDLCSAAGEPVATAFALSKLGLLEDVSGRYEAALERHLAAFATFEDVGNRGGVGYALSRASLTAYCLGRFQAALDFALAAYEGYADLKHHWGLIVVAARLGYAYAGLDRPAEARRWALHSLALSQGSHRIGQLHALGAVAAAMVRRGDDEGCALLRAILADPELPELFAIQPKLELARAQATGDDGAGADVASIDLDAVVSRLLVRPHPAPVVR